MATFDELQERTGIIVQDSSLTDLFPSFLNQGVQEIAGGMQSTLGSWVTPPLPELLTIGTVTTIVDTPNVVMPATFQRTMNFAVSEDGNELDIANSFLDFMETYPLLDQDGRISEVVEQGGQLYYQGIPPSEEVITVHFYRLPVDMEDGEDTPDGIPSHLQIDLLTNFAAWKAFELIEDGLEGEAPNTEKYKNNFYVSLRTLELFIPVDTRIMYLR